MPGAADRSHVGVRYAPPAPHGHVESYFLKANDPRRRRALWIKASIFAPRARPGASSPPRAIAETWAVAFDAAEGHVAVRTSVPYASARFSSTALDVEVDGLTLREDATRGTVASGGRRIDWSLAMEGAAPPLAHFPAEWMYSAPFPSFKLASPIPDVRLHGDIVVNGVRWSVDGWHGLVGHNWGPRHAPLYAWGHCNTWDAEPGAGGDASGDVVLEGVSARVKLGPVLSPVTTLLLVRHRGVSYELNALHDLVTNRGEISKRRWKFEGKNDLLRVAGEMWGETEDFVGLFYPNPDGTMTHCLNTKIGRARVEIEAHGHAPFVRRSSSAALEIGTMDPHHGVRMYV